MNIIPSFSLASYNTFKLPTRAEYGCIAHTKQDIIDAVLYALKHHLSCRVLGLGSNVLLPDTDLPGLTIIHRYERYDWQDDGSVILGGGNMLSASIMDAAKHQKDVSILLGYPSTIGGGIRGNSGLRGVGIGDFLVEGDVIHTKTGNIETWKKSDFHFSYRHSRLKEERDFIFIEGRFLFPQGLLSQEEVKKLQSYRVSTQPTGLCSGCFFMNPPEGSAGFLIDSAGLKGKKEGGAYISDKHANFLMSDGTATSKDILRLATYVQKRVKEVHNIDIVFEVDII